MAQVPLVERCPCNNSTFDALSLPHVEILSVSASPAYNVSTDGADSRIVPLNSSTVSVCNVSIQYTHPGQHDQINTLVHLPLDNWNGRYMTVGGGGWLTGLPNGLAAPVSQGYASALTDGGHDGFAPVASWALTEEGSLNWPNIINFVGRALDETTSLGKLATRAFYGRREEYAYWTGCSTGGRQGLMMAQRYAEQFDGILASAPAINWERWVMSDYWPVLMANVLDVKPPSCVLNAFKDAAIAACDLLDGVADGIISFPGLCDFDPQAIVGREIICSDLGETIEISPAHAQIISAAWDGPSTDEGKFEWYGLTQDAPLTSIIMSSCKSILDCEIAPIAFGPDWIKVFLARNESFDLSGLDNKGFSQLFDASVKEYASVIGTANPDLSNFKRAGGKMITWHGLADEIISPNGTYDYYSRALGFDQDLADYYRFFPAPGVHHCGGSGLDPSSTAFQTLVDWVEKGITPDTIPASAPALKDGSKRRMVNLCAYPKVLEYLGGDPDAALSYGCV